MTSFNSRAREGRDEGERREPEGREVSIHAPARGATRAHGVNGGDEMFQFTRPRGARPGPGGEDAGRNRFNSRAREGRDVRVHHGVLLNDGFNSRAREGRDGECYTLDGRKVVSIHAPARGATSNPARPISLASVSIHAPARGATQEGCNARRRSTVSIHAPARGATGPHSTKDRQQKFQFTRPRGARRKSGDWTRK